jgi:hypothetical protein
VHPALAAILISFFSGSAWAQQIATLPYAARTLPYSGYNTSVRGDIRTVGMAGATVGLGDTFIAASDNPAGLAMTLNGGDFNYTTNRIHDDYIQNFDSTMFTSSLGVAFAPYPWGFSLGYAQPYLEGQSYRLQSAPGDDAATTVTTRELRLGAARVFFQDKLSLGVSLNLGQVEQEIEIPNNTILNSARHAYTVGASFGAMYQLPYRILLGASAHLPMNYSSGLDATTPALPGFFQSVNVPARIATGVGWIPNRFFRADFTTWLIGRTTGAALLEDQSVEVGSTLTVQPRLGLAYNFVDFKDLSGTLFAGSYFEVTRVAVSSDRLHWTIGAEVKPWIFGLGWGLDEARGYKNYLVSFGVDLFKLAWKLDWIPRPWQPPRAGWLPSPMHFSDEGLSRPLVKDWKPQGPDLDPIKVSRELPGRFKKNIADAPKKLGEDFKDAGVDMFKAIIQIPSIIIPKKKPAAPYANKKPKKTKKKEEQEN